MSYETFRNGGAVRLLLSSVLLAAMLAAGGCNDGPLFPSQPLVQDTARLFSAAREDNLGKPSTFDFIRLAAFPVELPGTAGEWDVLLTEQGGQLVFVPSAALEQFPNGARLTVVTDRSFTELDRAPGERSEFTAAPRPVRTGDVYVVRVRETGCTRHAKFRVLDVDARTGAVRFEFVQNPNCGDRNLDFDD